MCNYEKVIGKAPCCTHDCGGCMFHEEDEKNETETLKEEMKNGL